MKQKAITSIYVDFSLPAWLHKNKQLRSGESPTPLKVLTKEFFPSRAEMEYQKRRNGTQNVASSKKRFPTEKGPGPERYIKYQI